MNRKVTRDEVIILMFFKLTWDSPCRFRPAVQQKIILWGWDPSPVLLGARTAPGRPGGPLDGSKDLAVTAAAPRDCPLAELGSVPAWWPQPVVTAHNNFCSCRMVMWHKVSPHHIEHQSKFIIWLKNNPWAPWTRRNDGFNLPFAILFFYFRNSCPFFSHPWEKFNLLCATVRSNQQVCYER